MVGTQCCLQTVERSNDHDHLSGHVRGERLESTSEVTVPEERSTEVQQEAAEQLEGPEHLESWEEQAVSGLPPARSSSCRAT